MELAGVRKDVAFACERFQVSERRACKLIGLDRGSYRYEPRPDRNVQLRLALVELARQKPRYGYRRLHALLVRRDHPASVMRIYRLYRAEGLAVRRLKRKRLSRVAAATQVVRSNQEWALDFVCDTLATGRGIRVLAVVDAFTRENLSLEVDTSLSSRRVTRFARKCDRTSRKTGSDSLRQRSGADQSAPSELVRGAEDSTGPHSARSTDAERPRGEFQRPPAGRVPKCKLVSQSDGR